LAGLAEPWPLVPVPWGLGEWGWPWAAPTDCQAALLGRIGKGLGLPVRIQWDLGDYGIEIMSVPPLRPARKMV